MTRAEPTRTIPDDYVFVWDDDFLPYPAYLAIKSVAVACKPARITLCKVPALDDVPLYRRLLREVPCLAPVNIDLPAWIEQANVPCGKELLEGYEFLQARKYHSAVSDLLRTLRLYLEGGVYLDTDTLTLRDLAPLRNVGAFLAEEHILVSSAVWKKNSPWRYFKTGPLTLARDICSRVSFGVAAFKTLSPFFVRAVHNAVMGFAPRHPLARDLLLEIAKRWPDRPKRYPILGPDSLQDLLAERTYEGVVVHPPQAFSPLGPTMTYQYFHERSPRVIAKVRAQVVTDETWAIHWSNNGTIAKAVPKSDEDLRRLGDRQLFSRLAIEAAFGGTLDASSAAA